MEEEINPNSFLILTSDLILECTNANGNGNNHLTSLQRTKEMAETLPFSTWVPAKKINNQNKSILRKNSTKKNLTVTFKEDYPIENIRAKGWFFLKKKKCDEQIIKPRGLVAFMEHAREGKKWLRETLGLGLSYPKARSTPKELNEIQLYPKKLEMIDDKSCTSKRQGDSSSRNEYPSFNSLKRKSLLKEEFSYSDVFSRANSKWNPYYSNDRVVLSNGLNNIEHINDFEVDLPIYAKQHLVQTTNYQDSFDDFNESNARKAYNHFHLNLSYVSSLDTEEKLSDFPNNNVQKNDCENELSNVNDEGSYYNLLDLYIDKNVFHPHGLNEKELVPKSVGSDESSSVFDNNCEKIGTMKGHGNIELNVSVDQQLKMLSKDSNMHYTNALRCVERLLNTQINFPQGSDISHCASTEKTIQNGEIGNEDNPERGFESEFNSLSTIQVLSDTGDIISNSIDGPKSPDSDLKSISLSRHFFFVNLKSKLKRSQSFANFIGKKDLDGESREIKRSMSFSKFRGILKKISDEKEDFDSRNSDNEIQELKFNQSARYSETSDDTSIVSLAGSNLGYANLERDEDSQQRFYSLEFSDSD